MVDLKGKKICIVGDSLTEHGHYVAYMRAAMKGAGDLGFSVYNCGIGGNRSDMVKALVKEDVLPYKPDYAAIFFGGNDLGIWLYDARKRETPPLLEERKARLNTYERGMYEAIDALQKEGISPIIFSVAAVSELFDGSKVETLGDNEEKKVNLDEGFYTKETYVAINRALEEELLPIAKRIAEEKGLPFLDLFTPTKKALTYTLGSHEKDGLHMTTKGYTVLAKIILNAFGYDVPACEELLDEENAEIKRVELLSRDIMFLKYNMCHPNEGNYTEEDILNVAKTKLNDPETPDWLKGTCQTYIDNNGDASAHVQEVVRRAKDYLYGTK